MRLQVGNPQNLPEGRLLRCALLLWGTFLGVTIAPHLQCFDFPPYPMLYDLKNELLLRCLLKSVKVPRDSVAMRPPLWTGDQADSRRCSRSSKEGKCALIWRWGAVPNPAFPILNWVHYRGTLKRYITGKLGSRVGPTILLASRTLESI